MDLNPFIGAASRVIFAKDVDVIFVYFDREFSSLNICFGLVSLYCGWSFNARCIEAYGSRRRKSSRCTGTGEQISRMLSVGIGIDIVAIVGEFNDML